MTYKGACLCGKVRFEIAGPILNIVQCHCSQCRKVQGSAFATNGFVARKDFTFISGQDELTAYKQTGTQTKFFCRHCGSPVCSENIDRPDDVRVRLGTIESDISERPEAHIFVASKANWDIICDNLPCYDEFEPGR